jgi:transcriptional regulator NrdR family protein
MRLEPYETISCPHCEAEQDDVAEDYTISSKTGPESSSEEECWNCGKKFTSTKLIDGVIEVIFN